MLASLVPVPLGADSSRTWSTVPLPLSSNPNARASTRVMPFRVGVACSLVALWRESANWECLSCTGEPVTLGMAGRGLVEYSLVVELCAGGLRSRWGDEGLFKSSRKTGGLEFLSEVEGWTNGGPGTGVLDMESRLPFLSFLF